MLRRSGKETDKNNLANEDTIVSKELGGKTKGNVSRTTVIYTRGWHYLGDDATAHSRHSQATQVFGSLENV